MPRNFQAGLLEFLARKNKQAESHSTLHLTVDMAKPARNYYFATAALTIDNIAYEPLMRSPSEIRTSLARAADQTVCELLNADAALGLELLSLGAAIYSAGMEIGQYWKDLESGAEWHEILFTGVLVDSDVQEVVRLTAVSEPYANIPCGALRRVTRECGAIYKDPATCQSTSSEPTCNFLLNHSGGCVNRHSGTNNRAAFFGFAYLNTGNRLMGP
jgi:hypothetical protein